MRMNFKIIFCVVLALSSVHLEADGPKQANGLIDQLVVPSPYQIHKGQMEIQVVLKNVSSAPIRVCTLCGRWAGTGKDFSSVDLIAGVFKSAPPTVEKMAQAVVTILPGASLTLNCKCVLPETNRFRLTVGYSISPEMARQLNTWQGDVDAEPVMITIPPSVHPL